MSLKRESADLMYYGEGEESMNREEAEELFQKFSFWGKLTEVEKRLLEQQVRWNQYHEGQLVTGTGS